MNTVRFYLLGISVCLAGCGTPSKPLRPEALVKPGLIMIPEDQAQYYQKPSYPKDGYAEVDGQIAASDARSVLTEQAVSAIQFNRYPDPAAPDRLMHEAHIVYRRESAPRWVLPPGSAKQQILVGAQLTDGRGEVRPLVSQELDTFLQDQRAHAVRQQEAMAKLSEHLEQLGEQQRRLSLELAEIKTHTDSGTPDKIDSDSDGSGEAASQGERTTR